MMTVKRQKLFFLPALPALGTLAMGGLTVGQMAQSAGQAEEAEAQNRQQVKALNRLARAAEQNPAVAKQVAAGVGNIKQKEESTSVLTGIQKEFAAINMKELGGFAKDMGKFAWGKRKHIVSGLAMGGGMAASGAVVDKMIQKDIKKNNLPFLDQQQPQQQQFSEVGGWQKYASQGQDLAKRGIKSMGRELKNTFDFSIKKTVGENGKKKLLPKFGGGWMTAGFAAMPVAGYIAEKKQYQDQLKATTQGQKQFAKVNGSMLTGLKNWWKGKPIEKGLNTVAGFFNNGENGKQMAENISNIGKQSGNKYTQQLGKWLGNHGKTAAVGAIGVGGAVMSAGWGQGEKLTKKAIKSVDPNAYAYQDSKEQQIPQQ